MRLCTEWNKIKWGLLELAYSSVFDGCHCYRWETCYDRWFRRIQASFEMRNIIEEVGKLSLLKVDNDSIQTPKLSVKQFKANLSFPNYSWKKFQIYIWLSVFIYQAPCPQQIAFLNNKMWDMNLRLSLIKLKFLGKMGYASGTNKK